MDKSILKKEKCKNNKGFSLIELIIAMAILVFISVPIFKAFFVSTKVNVESYEKDRSNIAVVNKIEEIKKNPDQFIKDNGANTETRYYKDLFNGAYYYFLCEKSLDEQAFKEYVENIFTIFPNAPGWDKTDGGSQAESRKNSCEKKYNKKDVYYYDKGRFEQLLLGKKEKELSGIKCIINKCSTTEYYDSDWKITENKASAKYEAQIEVSRKAENHATQYYDPETVFKPGDRYDVPGETVKEYFAILRKGEEADKYVFYIFYNYSSKDFKSDLKEIYGTTNPKGPNDLKDFFSALCHFQGENLDKENSFDKFYKVFEKHTKIGDGTISPKQLDFKVEKGKTSIPVRMDFDDDSTQPIYNVEVYNMTDKPMELYIPHNGVNKSEVVVKLSRGETKKTVVYTTKNIAKTVYKIDVKVKRKDDSYNLINYKTEKYVSGEEAQDFDFDGK